MDSSHRVTTSTPVSSHQPRSSRSCRPRPVARRSRGAAGLGPAPVAVENDPDVARDLRRVAGGRGGGRRRDRARCAATCRRLASSPCSGRRTASSRTALTGAYPPRKDQPAIRAPVRSRFAATCRVILRSRSLLWAIAARTVPPPSPSGGRGASSALKSSISPESVKPKLRGWLHAGNPGRLVAGIVLIVLAGDDERSRRVSPPPPRCCSGVSALYHRGIGRRVTDAI